MDETWLPVLDYEGLYEVSDLGRVRSLDRDVVTGNGIRHYRGKILAVASTNGYPSVKLSRMGRQVNKPVHLLVLGAHVGRCPPGKEARHGPAGKTDASKANLCYGTRSENTGPDRVRDGASNRGERHGIAVLTEEIVIDIRQRVSAGERQIDLAAEHGVSKQLVWAVIHGKSWDWLPS